MIFLHSKIIDAGLNLFKFDPIVFCADSKNYIFKFIFRVVETAEHVFLVPISVTNGNHNLLSPPHIL